MIFLLFLFQDALPPPPPPPPQSSVDGAAYSLAAGQRPSPSISDQSGRQRPTVWVIKTAPHTNVSRGLHIIGRGGECKSPPPSCLCEYVHRWSDWWSPGSHWSSSPSPLTSEPSQLPSLLLPCSTQLIRVRSPHSCLFFLSRAFAGARTFDCKAFVFLQSPSTLKSEGKHPSWDALSSWLLFQASSGFPRVRGCSVCQRVWHMQRVSGQIYSTRQCVEQCRISSICADFVMCWKSSCLLSWLQVCGHVSIHSP